MRWMNRLRRRIEFLLRRPQFASELEEEMRFHQELQVEEGGLSREQARRQFGNMTLAAEESREAWGWGPLERLCLDVRYACRMLRKDRGFTATVVLTLALGIGANTAVFSVVNAIVFRPLPFRDPGQLHMLWERWEKKRDFPAIVSPEDFTAWREQSRSFERMAAIQGWQADITVGDEPTQFPAVRVTSDFFDLLGVQPAVGRAFLPDEWRGEENVVVIGYGLWQKLGGNRDLVGQTVNIYREPYRIAGIMPRGFAFPDECQVWFPVSMASKRGPSGYSLRVVGRLKAGVSLEQARVEMDTIAARLRHARGNRGYKPPVGVDVVPLHEQVVGHARHALVVLLGAVACVLLIGCANVANLLLARARRRQREVALRLAIGASRWRVVRLLVVESVLLALAGGALGLAWADLGVRLFVGLDPLKLPRLSEVAVDAQVLLFTFLVAVGTGVLFGLAPALRISRPDLNATLKEGSERAGFNGSGRNRARNVLAIAQIALAVVLLVSAGLLLRSFERRISVPLGFRPEGALATELPWSANRQIDRILERLRGLPGVQAAGAATSFPQDPANTSGGLSVEGRPQAPGEELVAGRMPVTPDYFRAAGLTLRKGRLFTDADGADAPKVAIVNETLVRRYMSGRNPIGRHIQTTDGRIWRTVVGVVSDAKSFGMDGDPLPEVYLPYRQDSWNNPVYIVVRTTLPPASLVLPVRKEIRAISKNWILKIETLEDMLARTVAVPRFYMALMVAFAVLAVVLAVVGIYGVISYSIAQRTHEIGVRMALGAEREDVLRMVVGQVLVLILAGVGIGLAGAWVSTRALESLLFQVHARDAAAFAGATVLFIGVGLAACYLPARRATRIDPMAALRWE